MSSAPEKGAGHMTSTTDTPILIRRATEDDTTALRRLAPLDAAPLPEGDLLVAEVDGELKAAPRIADSAYVADPFYASKELVGLLDVRAKRLRRDEHSKVERTRTRLGGWSPPYTRALQSPPTLWARPAEPAVRSARSAVRAPRPKRGSGGSAPASHRSTFSASAGPCLKPCPEPPPSSHTRPSCSGCGATRKRVSAVSS